MKNISLDLWKRNELLTARKYHFHVPINNCMKHVPRRRLLANFFVLPSYVILLYDVQFCNTNTPTYPIILYHKHKKLKACVCPFNFDKTYPFYLMRISCSKVFNHQAVEEKNLMVAMTDNLLFWVTFAIFVIVWICLLVISESCTSHDDGDDDIYPHIR